MLTKSHTGSKFFKIYLGLCAREGQLCTHSAVFLCGVRWCHSRAPNSEPHVFVNFVALRGRIASSIIMRPSSVGGGRALRRTLAVCPSVPLSSVTSRHLANYNDTLRAAYRTAISAAQTCYGLMCTQFRRLLENYRCTLQRIKPFRR